MNNMAMKHLQIRPGSTEFKQNPTRISLGLNDPSEMHLSVYNP